ncbi:membrane protein, partial [Cellulomonas bogoriensis 69B4 = DSM 16987]
MEIVRNIALVLHFIGLAAVIGSFMVQMKAPTKRVDPAMLHGALTLLASGVILVGALEMGDGTVNHVKITVKLLVLLVVTALVVLNRRKDVVATGV